MAARRQPSSRAARNNPRLHPTSMLKVSTHSPEFLPSAIGQAQTALRASLLLDDDVSKSCTCAMRKHSYSEGWN